MEKLIIVKTKAEFEALAAYVEQQDLLAVDTETTGVERESNVIGFSLCAELDLAHYVVLQYWDATLDEPKLVRTEIGGEDVYDLMLVLKSKGLIMQNAPFDCATINNNFGVELMQSVVYDTMIAGHLLNENCSNGLKERGVELFGESAAEEQRLMKESIYKNGGVLTKEKYELYKADVDLLAHYGAKDALLTWKVYLHDSDLLAADETLWKFFMEESMPLLRGPTYDMNTEGLKVDSAKLQALRCSLEADCLESKAFIYKEIDAHVKEKYKGTTKNNTFNIDATQQRAWLLYHKLDNQFTTLTKGGRALCKAVGLRLPYTAAARREFVAAVSASKGRIWAEAEINKKTKKMGRPKKIADPWTYMGCGKESLAKLADKYRWVEEYLKYAKNMKLLNTYAIGIQERMKYGVIRPSFLQHGTTSGRYSSRGPNFQNLPRDDKRVKACIVARSGKVFVGADYAQLEPRVFASISQDETLMACFAKGDDFYSVVGAPIFGITGCSMIKDAPNSFANLHKKLRDKAKVIALATPYGRTAAQQASTMGIEIDESQKLIDAYFDAYPKVEIMMLDSHEQAKKNGVVYNLYGRPRRIPDAKDITKIYGNAPHAELPYLARNMLNLAQNFRVQSTAASIVNRSAIKFWTACRELALVSPAWEEVKVVLQCHDELIVEGPEGLKSQMIEVLKDAMENTCVLPGVGLVAEPKVATNMADLK